MKKLSLNSKKIAKGLRRRWKNGREFYCTNALVKTELVRDWIPPHFLSSGEDVHLSRHIINKGYKTILLEEHYVKHHGIQGLRSAKKKSWHYSGIRLLKYTSVTTKWLVRRFITSPLRGFYIGVKLREPRVIPYIILSDFYSLKGWLQWNKYIVWRR